MPHPKGTEATRSPAISRPEDIRWIGQKLVLSFLPLMSMADGILPNEATQHFFSCRQSPRLPHPQIIPLWRPPFS